MSDETLRVPGLSEDDHVLVNLLAEKLRKHASRNRFRSDLYDGKQAIRQVGSVIPPQYYQLGLALGWAAQGVDGLARRCGLDRMVWTDGDLDSLGMREFADSNFLFSELAQARTDSLIHGVSYLITTKGGDGEPAALVHAKDALSATGEWNHRAKRLDNLLSVTSWDGKRITGFVLYKDGVTINADRVGGKWETDQSEHSWGVPVDPLIYRPRASRRMGRSRITRPAISHQSAALRALVRLEGHMDVYAIPQLILLGADESIFKNPDGSYKAAWQVALGRVLGVPDADPEDLPAGSTGRADVKHVAAQSPEPHLADLNALAKLSAREYNLPDSDFALTDLANPTAEGAYYAGRDNLLAEAEGATRVDWAPSITRTVARGLAIQNGEIGVPKEWASITPDWLSPLYLSRAQEADAGAKQIGAVPWLANTRVGLRKLGLSELEIDEALAERRQNAGRDAVAALIAARGSADGDTGRVEGAAATAGG